MAPPAGFAGKQIPWGLPAEAIESSASSFDPVARRFTSSA